MDDVKDFCNKPRVVHTGMGWGVRIDGTDVMEGANQYGFKTLRTFDIVIGLSSKQEAEAYLLQWLGEQAPELDAQRLRADTAEAALKIAGEDVALMLKDLDAAEQRIGRFAVLLGRADVFMYIMTGSEPEKHLNKNWKAAIEVLRGEIDAALNPKPEAGSHE